MFIATAPHQYFFAPVGATHHAPKRSYQFLMLSFYKHFPPNGGKMAPAIRERHGVKAHSDSSDIPYPNWKYYLFKSPNLSLIGHSVIFAQN